MVCRCVHAPPPFLAYTMIQLLPRYAQMHTQVPELEAGAGLPSFETWDRICKLYGWPQTFVRGRRNA